jgi:nucleoid-associated protein
MGILNIIVHEVQKEDSKSPVKLICREEENVADQHAELLSSHLTALFRKTGLNTGGFGILESEDDPEPHFVVLLKRFFCDSQFKDFVTFTSAAARHFKKQLEKSGGAKGGYLLFNHYTYGDENFLSVVLLRKKFGLSLSDDLTLDEIEELDLDKLHMAARINLSAWKSRSSEKYISFRIGKDAKDVTDYFSEFIGCVEYTRAKVDTQNLVSVTKRFCSELGLSDNKSEEIKNFVFDQCISWLEEEVPVHLDQLSKILDSKLALEDSGRFLELAQGDPYFLTNEIPVEKRILKGLKRYIGRDSKLSISFDSDLLNVSIFYDGENGLRITNIPSGLKDQLREG